MTRTVYLIVLSHYSYSPCSSYFVKFHGRTDDTTHNALSECRGDGGSVEVVGSESNVTVNDATADGGDGGTTGGDGGAIRLQSSDDTYPEPINGNYPVPEGLLTLTGDYLARGGDGDTIFDMGVGGLILLNADDKGAPAGVATIVGVETDGTLVIDVTGRTPDLADLSDPTTSVAGNVMFGENEKFTSIGRTGTPGDGDLTVLGNGGTFTFSDLTVDGSLRVNGNTVRADGERRGAVAFNLRDPGLLQSDATRNGDGVFDTDDVVRDQGLDVVVRGALIFRGVTFETSTQISGDADVDPQFALVDPNAFSLNLIDAGYVIRILPKFRGLFGPSGEVLDHRAELPSITSVAPSFAFDLPMEEWWFDVGQGTAPTRPQVEDLQPLGVFARDYTASELTGQLGLNAFDGLPQSHEPQPQDYAVPVGRVDYERVEDSLRLHRELSTREVVDADALRTLVDSLIDLGLTRGELLVATETLITSLHVEGVSATDLVDQALAPPVVEIEIEVDVDQHAEHGEDDDANHDGDEDGEHAEDGGAEHDDDGGESQE